MQRFLAACLLALLAAPAAAANVGNTSSYESQLSGATDATIELSDDDSWSGVIGGGVGIAPEFIGSDDLEAVGLPLIDVEWREAYFLSTERGLGLNFIRTPTLKIGPRLTYDKGRDSSESAFLAGLPDVESSIEIGAFLEAINGPWRFKTDIRQGIGSDGHNGFVFSGDIALGGRLSERANLVLGAVGHYASTNYVESYFEVGVAGPNRPVFATDGGGLTDLGAYATLVYNLSDRVFLSGMMRGAVLFGDAADSPISQSNGQYFFGTLFGYRF